MCACATLFLLMLVQQTISPTARTTMEDQSNLMETLEKCLSTPGVHLIDCPVDYSENDEILNNKIKADSAKI